jgi:hypothetical protein
MTLAMRDRLRRALRMVTAHSGLQRLRDLERRGRTRHVTPASFSLVPNAPMTIKL